MTEGPGRADLQGPVGNVYDKYGSRNPLVRLLVRRFLRAVDGAVDAAPPGSVLDVGCGEGVVTERIARRRPGSRVVGVDVGDPRLEAEWRGRRRANLAFQQASAYSLPYPDDAFELVCALELLEHLERPGEALRELARVASASLLLSVPREPLWRLLNLASGRYPRALGNTPGHVNHWSRAAFTRLAAEAGEVQSAAGPLPWTVVTVRTGRGPGAAAPSRRRLRRSAPA